MSYCMYQSDKDCFRLVAGVSLGDYYGAKSLNIFSNFKIKRQFGKNVKIIILGHVSAVEVVLGKIVLYTLHVIYCNSA